MTVIYQKAHELIADGRIQEANGKIYIGVGEHDSYVVTVLTLDDGTPFAGACTCDMGRAQKKVPSDADPKCSHLAAALIVASGSV